MISRNVPLSKASKISKPYPIYIFTLIRDPTMQVLDSKQNEIKDLQEQIRLLHDKYQQ